MRHEREREREGELHTAKRKYHLHINTQERTVELPQPPKLVGHYLSSRFALHLQAEVIPGTYILTLSWLIACRPRKGASPKHSSRMLPIRIAEASDSLLHLSPTHPSICLLAAEPASGPLSLLEDQRIPSRTDELEQHL